MVGAAVDQYVRSFAVELLVNQRSTSARPDNCAVENQLIKRIAVVGLVCFGSLLLIVVRFVGEQQRRGELVVIDAKRVAGDVGDFGPRPLIRLVSRSLRLKSTCSTPASANPISRNSADSFNTLMISVTIGVIGLCVNRALSGSENPTTARAAV